MKKLVYFERWVAPIAGEILGTQPDIDIVRMECASEARNWQALGAAHGYQALTRPESKKAPRGEQWLPDSNLLERSPKLLAVCVAGAGADVVDIDACTRAGVIVCNQSGSGRESVAEHALAMILALSKRIGVADRVMRRELGYTQLTFQGNDVFGKTLGVIGFGQIGSRLAEMCRAALGMTILAHDPYLDAAQIAARGGTKVTLDELLERSDFVSLNGPLTDETRGMLGRAQFTRMKRGAFFVTTSRGGVHDEDALVEALASGHLGGAGIDVFVQEPPPLDHPLFRFDNVIATPHTAGITVEGAQSIAEATAKQWIEIFRGAVPPRLLNPAAWPRYSERFEKILGARPAALV